MLLHLQSMLLHLQLCNGGARAACRSRLCSMHP
jgi:hypothetical protein